MAVEKLTSNPRGPGDEAGQQRPEKPALKLGFMPLTDCAPLVVAKEIGIFHDHGLDVTLSKEASWATIRDKVIFGQLDGAHMLAGMPISASLGLGGVQKAMISALSLGLNGNAVSVSCALFDALVEENCGKPLSPTETGPLLRRVITTRRTQGKRQLVFAHVFPVSNHNYQLRYWMAAAGIDPDQDVKLVVIPPPRIGEALRDGLIDGFCVGEPWNVLAAHQGLSQVLLSGHAIWNNAPEKVLGVTAEWHRRHPFTHRALIQSLICACKWLDDPENRPVAAEMLSTPEYLDADPALIAAPWVGQYPHESGSTGGHQASDFNVFNRLSANFPWVSHAEWVVAQMYRWGQLERALNVRELAQSVYRPDVYRAAAFGMDQPFPTIDEKPEGIHTEGWQLSLATKVIEMGPDLFIDGDRFHPEEPIDEYLDRQRIKHLNVDFTALRALNEGIPTNTAD